MDYTLGWGIPVPMITEFYPDVAYQQNVTPKKLNFGFVQLLNFYGDCGALTLNNAKCITQDTMKAVLQYASLSGFTKIFATVVGSDSDRQREVCKIFRDYRWKCVHKGKSNRNPRKDEFVFVKIIRKPKHIGY